MESALRVSILRPLKGLDRLGVMVQSVMGPHGSNGTAAGLTPEAGRRQTRKCKEGGNERSISMSQTRSSSPWPRPGESNYIQVRYARGDNLKQNGNKGHTNIDRQIVLYTAVTNPATWLLVRCRAWYAWRRLTGIEERFCGIAQQQWLFWRRRTSVPAKREGDLRPQGATGAEGVTHLRIPQRSV